MFKRVLVAVDHSNRSERAVQQAVTLAERTGAELILAHVIEPDGVSEDAWAKVTYADHKHVGTLLLERYVSKAKMWPSNSRNRRLERHRI
jgi:nucleotide-binding universal stress UspA family protein